MTNGIYRLPCGYLYRPSHWIGKLMSGLCTCCRRRGSRLFMVHVFNSHPWALFEITHNGKHTKQEPEVTYGKWSVQASKQANIHTHMCNEATLVWGSLRLAPITVIYYSWVCLHYMASYSFWCHFRQRVLEISSIHKWPEKVGQEEVAVSCWAQNSLQS